MDLQRDSISLGFQGEQGGLSVLLRLTKGQVGLLWRRRSYTSAERGLRWAHRQRSKTKVVILIHIPWRPQGQVWFLHFCSPWLGIEYIPLYFCMEENKSGKHQARATLLCLTALKTLRSWELLDQSRSWELPLEARIGSFFSTTF